MHSSIVVTSWWSNCLALNCLHRLAVLAPERELYVMQAGKTEEQMEYFREFLPDCVTELPYPTHLLADDWAMREYLARDVLSGLEGAWFQDHDTFLLEPAEAWFAESDTRFATSAICLCTRRPAPGAGITQPTYWLSPQRWPDGLSSFAPVPFEPKPFSARPDLHWQDGQLTRPGKDTLVQVREELEVLGLAGTFPDEDADPSGHILPPFLPCVHIGGLHLYTGPAQLHSNPPPGFLDWRRHTAMGFDS
ncbi:MAG: hypothetical protein KAI66_28185, partial [Lentisphaeria bacterium]|nr:hypothetical protein [Lentisphaeria bacterium]